MKRSWVARFFFKKSYQSTSYDGWFEDLKPESDLIEVVSKNKHGLILKNIEHNFTYERTFQHLMDCEIEEL